MRLQPAHLYEAAAHHEEGHQIGQHKVGQIVAESGFLVKVFFLKIGRDCHVVCASKG